MHAALCVGCGAEFERLIECESDTEAFNVVEEWHFRRSTDASHATDRNNVMCLPTHCSRLNVRNQGSREDYYEM